MLVIFDVEGVLLNAEYLPVLASLFGPEKEKDGEGAGQRRHDVDHQSRIMVWAAQNGKETAENHENRRSGRMPHLKIGGCGDKLPAIPETGCGFDG